MPMTGRTLRLLPIALAVGIGTAACGGETETTRVYFLRDGKVAPVARTAAADVFRGPSAAERATGLATGLPPGPVNPLLTRVGRPGLAQLVYTVTQAGRTS